MAAQPTGPVDVGGDLSVIVQDQDSGEGYSLTFYPDGSNDQLRNEGKPMSFYYIPNRIRLAREPNGDYMFHFQEFGGVMDKDSNVGVGANYEIAGGLLTFSTTMEIPPAIFLRLTQTFTEKLKVQYASNPLLFWNERFVPPNFQPITINSGTTSMDTQNFGAVMNETDRNAAGGNTAFEIQGNGKMNLSATGLNTYSTMVGLIPAASIKASLQAGHSTLVVRNLFKYFIKSVGYKIHMRGDWSQIYTHFSAALKGHYLWASADLSASFDSLKLSGSLVVEIEDNPFIISDAPDKIAKAKELAMKMFAEKMQEAIFEKVPMEKPAEAKDSGWFWGVGVAMKFKSVRKEGSFTYDEIYKTTLERETKADGVMQGIHHELVKSNNDPNVIKKYFSTVDLGSMFQKVHVIATSNAYWKTPDGGIGDPINRLAIEVGYKTGSSILVKNSARYKDSLTAKLSDPSDLSPAFWTADTKDRIYVFDFMKNKNLPEDQQNQVMIRKIVSYNEDPRVAKSLTRRPTAIEETTNEHTIEVRADSLGKFGATFTIENAENIAGNKQIKVLVTCSMDGIDDQVLEFNGKNAETPQKWELWFEKFADIPTWKYKVDVHISGKNFSQRMIKYGKGFETVVQKGADMDFMIPLPEVPADLQELVEKYLS